MIRVDVLSYYYNTNIIRLDYSSTINIIHESDDYTTRDTTIIVLEDYYNTVNMILQLIYDTTTLITWLVSTPLGGILLSRQHASA